MKEEYDLHTDLEKAAYNNLKHPHNPMLLKDIFGYFFYCNEAKKYQLKDSLTEDDYKTIDLIYKLEDIIKIALDNNDLDLNDIVRNCEFTPIFKDIRTVMYSYDDIARNFYNLPNSDLIKASLRIMIFRDLSKKAFLEGNYDTAYTLNRSALKFFYLNSLDYYQDKELYFKNMLSENNRENSLSYWRPKKIEKEERKSRYLKVMNEKGYSKYVDAANYIFEKDNLENRGYRQIYDELREADNEKKA